LQESFSPILSWIDGDLDGHVIEIYVDDNSNRHFVAYRAGEEGESGETWELGC